MFANCQKGGTNLAAPDVCKTPVGSSVVPIPYPNTALGATANPSTVAKKVLISGAPAHNLQTVIPMSNGDNAGVVGGVKSGQVMGQSRHTKGADSVLIAGSPATKLTDMTGQNGSSSNITGATIAPAQTTVMIMKGDSSSKKDNETSTKEEYSICIELSDPDEDPFIHHRLPVGTKIEYHLDFTGMDQGNEDVIPSSGTFTFNKSKHSITVSKADWEKLKSIIIWGKEYGGAAFIHPDGDVALGRLQISRDSAQVIESDGSEGKFELAFKGSAIMSVVDFIVSEANKNRRDPELAKIKKMLTKADSAQDEDDREDLMDDADYDFGHKVHKNEGGMGFLQDVYFLGGGEWDYKPVIRDVWGAKERLGNSKYVYFYDMWANFHYGFMGRLAGFDKSHLIDEANKVQKWDNGAYDPVDDVLTQIGYDMKSFTREALLAEIQANRDDFKLSSRDLYGSNQDAAKKYVAREFGKRSIPLPKEEYW